MKLPPPLRLVVSIFFVLLATGLVWWLVGYQLGKVMVSGSDASSFRRGMGLEDAVFLRLAFFALAGGITVAAGVAGKWLPLAGIAFGAAVLYPDHTAGTAIGVPLFVLVAAGVAEISDGLRSALVALGAAIAISFVFTIEGSFGRSEMVVIALLRGIFWFFPLLVLPERIDVYVLKTLGF